MDKKEIFYIDTQQKLREMINYILRYKEQISLDIECEYNLHRYGMHLCLIQLFDGEKCYLIDPVKIVNIKLMRRLFNSKIIKVMFASHGDICLLKHLYKFPIKNIFDVQVAAKLVGYEKLSLSTVIEEVLDLKIKKSKRKQKANWNIRPLPNDLIEYAIDDVIYLFKLRDELEVEINEQNLEEELFLENKKLEQAAFKPKNNPHLRIKNARHLNQCQKKYLKAFYNVRDMLSKKLDMSPHFLLKNETLIEISRKIPQNRAEWLALKGLHKKAWPFIHCFMKSKSKVDFYQKLK